MKANPLILAVVFQLVGLTYLWRLRLGLYALVVSAGYWLLVCRLAKRGHLTRLDMLFLWLGLPVAFVFIIILDKYP